MLLLCLLISLFIYNTEEKPRNGVDDILNEYIASLQKLSEKFPNHVLEVQIEVQDAPKPTTHRSHIRHHRRRHTPRTYRYNRPTKRQVSHEPLPLKNYYLRRNLQYPEDSSTLGETTTGTTETTHIHMTPTTTTKLTKTTTATRTTKTPMKMTTTTPKTTVKITETGKTKKPTTTKSTTPITTKEISRKSLTTSEEDTDSSSDVETYKLEQSKTIQRILDDERIDEILDQFLITLQELAEAKAFEKLVQQQVKLDKILYDDTIDIESNLVEPSTVVRTKPTTTWWPIIIEKLTTTSTTPTTSTSSTTPTTPTTTTIITTPKMTTTTTEPTLKIRRAPRFRKMMIPVQHEREVYNYMYTVLPPELRFTKNTPLTYKYNPFEAFENSFRYASYFNKAF